MLYNKRYHFTSIQQLIDSNWIKINENEINNVIIKIEEQSSVIKNKSCMTQYKL